MYLSCRNLSRRSARDTPRRGASCRSERDASLRWTSQAWREEEATARWRQRESTCWTRAWSWASVIWFAGTALGTYPHLSERERERERERESVFKALAPTHTVPGEVEVIAAGKQPQPELSRISHGLQATPAQEVLSLHFLPSTTHNLPPHRLCSLPPSSTPSQEERELSARGHHITHFPLPRTGLKHTLQSFSS